MPQVPSVLVKHEELPFGDRELATITRSMRAALDLLEPRWGRLIASHYTVEADKIGSLQEQLRDAMPDGWRRVDTAFPAERGQLVLYSSDEKLFGLLIVPVADGPIRPVLIITNMKA